MLYVVYLPIAFFCSILRAKIRKGAAVWDEGSLLRWEPQPHAAAPCTSYTPRRDHPANPTWQAALASRAEDGEGTRRQWRRWRGSQKCGHRAPWSRPTEPFSDPNPLSQLPVYIHTRCGAAGLRPPAAGWEAEATAPGASPRRGLLRPPISPGCVPAPFARHPPFKYTLGPTLRPSRI